MDRRSAPRDRRPFQEASLMPHPSPVLFVDDDADLCDTFRDTLHYLGYEECVLACSLKGAQAQHERALACRLAILDVNLGTDRPTGVDVFRWLEREGFRGKVVFLTGHGGDDPRVHAAGQVSGAQLLAKPINLEDMRRLLADALK
jgi:DNA-binding NtrC family response regulator